MSNPVQRVFEKRKQDGGKALSGNHEEIWDRDISRSRLEDRPVKQDLRLEVKCFASNLRPQTSHVYQGMVEMKMIQNIPLQQIDLLDETFSVNYLPDLHRLRSSIGQIGMIQPVFLRKKLGGYQIICGFRRISVLKELEKSEIESRVFEEEEMEEFHLFFLSLQENLTTRGFNAIERAMALEKLIHRFQIHPDTVIHTFLPLFSLEPNEKILNTYLSLTQMEDEIKTYVLREEVSRSNIRRLSALNSDDRRAVLSLISPLKLGENRLREVLTFLEEISRRD